ncbi:MAG: hypothetical protein ACYTDW_20415 [Planctomycetota bacterium]
MSEMRVCVHVERPTMLPSVTDRMNMTMWDSMNVLRNIVHFLRNQYNGVPQKRARIEDIQTWTGEPTDDPRVCIVWNPETRQIRISLIGLDEWQAEIACDLAANQIERDLLDTTEE